MEKMPLDEKKMQKNKLFARVKRDNLILLIFLPSESRIRILIEIHFIS